MSAGGSHSSSGGEWSGPGVRPGKARRFWRTVLWSLVYPSRHQSIRPTVPGVFLILVSMGIGTAAYNSASNILFLTLALMLACLVLSGVMSWLNVRGVSWRLEAQPPMRADRPHPVSLEIRNEKRFIPTYGLWFELRNRSARESVKLTLTGRLDAQDVTRLDWTIRPAKRGLERIELVAVGSLFPFGFLRKSFGTDLSRDVIVWPAPIEYRRYPISTRQRVPVGSPLARVGQSADLFSLRRYRGGDSHREIHWKASARLRQLMVRQFSAETHEGVSLWLQTTAEVWTRPAQFEQACSFAATLAEDLFKAGKLAAVALNDEALTPVRRLADLEAFLDRVALVDRVPLAGPSSRGAGGQIRAGGKIGNLLTFVPEGAQGVAAYVDGEKAAAT